MINNYLVILILIYFIESYFHSIQKDKLVCKQWLSTFLKINTKDNAYLDFYAYLLAHTNSSILFVNFTVDQRHAGVSWQNNKVVNYH